MRRRTVELGTNDEEHPEGADDQPRPLRTSHAQAQQRAHEHGDHERLHGIGQRDGARRDACRDRGIDEDAVAELGEQSDDGLPSQDGRADAARDAGDEHQGEQDGCERDEPPDEQGER